MELTNSKTQIIISIIGLAGVLGGALFTNWEKVFPKERNVPQDVRKDASPTPQTGEQHKPSASPTASPRQVERSESEPSQFDISGTWYDSFGGIHTITQHGNKFDFVTTNPNNGYAAQGNGTISGRSVKSFFQSNLPSTGDGTGTISTDGKQMMGTCRDTRLGQYGLTLYR